MFKTSRTPILSAPNRASRTAVGLATVALALIAVPALAQTSYKPAGPIASMFEPGQSYIALNAGTSDLTRPITAFGVFGGDQQGQAYSITMGNYMAGQNYGFELGYLDLGSVNRDGGRTKVDGINLSLIGRLPVTSNFNLLGKVGTTYSRTDVSTNAANASKQGSERGFDWAYGLGGELVLSPQWAVTLQYNEHFVKYPTSGSERVSSTMLGARYYY